MGRIKYFIPIMFLNFKQLFVVTAESSVTHFSEVRPKSVLIVLSSVTFEVLVKAGSLTPTKLYAQKCTEYLQQCWVWPLLPPPALQSVGGTKKGVFWQSRNWLAGAPAPAALGGVQSVGLELRQ